MAQSKKKTKADNSDDTKAAKHDNKQERKLISPRFSLAEFKRQVFSIDVESGTTLEDILTPEYWGPVVDQLKTKARLECHWEDNSEFAELVVLSAGKAYCNVALLFHRKFGGNNTDSSYTNTGYSVAHKGNFDKWCVIRESDNTRIQKGFETEGQAKKWLDEYLGV